ncbi:MAG: methionine synthase [Proteobacteria bacterium]|nr:methionine synthase [Pseudomonadota bacterium]
MEILKHSLHERILVLDGAMGTSIQKLHLSARDFGGTQFEGCNEQLVISKPAIISSIYEDYLKAGADILETNTFGATPLVLEEYGLGHQTELINYEAAQIARRCADKHCLPNKPRFVAGAMGPTTKAISVTGGILFHELISHFYRQAKGLLEGGVDYFLLETCQDTRNIKAALFGIDRVLKETNKQIPIALSITIEAMGTMLAGQSIEALTVSVSHRDLLYLGLNCATGPEFMTDSIRSLSMMSPFPVACVPNAGLPDENGYYLETPEMLSRTLSGFISNGWINLVGGCCGTEASHIAALSKIVTGKSPRKPKINPRSMVSGLDFLEINEQERPVIVGERTNVIGSKKFKNLILENRFDEASDIARQQIKGGAHIIDVCLANPDRDELSDMSSFLGFLIKKIKAPLMIDSTDEQVIESALSYCQGKSIINSINLEDGEERFEKVLPLAKKFGAAVVVGTIDEDPIQGMGITRQRKLAIAVRAFDLLTNKHGIKPEDIFWDPLVFPCATGDQQYLGSAIETIEGIKLLKKHFPKTKTILGISNISFGLPDSGREVLNSVFLYLCVQAGLDLAIVNSEKLKRYASIPDDEKQLAEDLLFHRGTEPITNFANFFRKKKASVKPSKPSLSLQERLALYVIEGSKDGLVEDLNLALKQDKPLEIINGPLMKGMDEVGRLFNANKLIVAEVLQSAEVMKAAVNHLEPFMEKTESAQKGSVLLATVKGDVHDIGKNLVDIILSNNGFRVINLGIKIPPEQLIGAVRQYQPDILGLSGLLVKSAQQMVLTAGDLSRAGIQLPLLVGGAALSEKFTIKQIAPAYSGMVIYASDAMDGLDICKKLVTSTGKEELERNFDAKSKALESELPLARSNEAPTQERSSIIRNVSVIPPAPDYRRHVLRDTPIDQIWRYVNPLMVYGRHLGLNGQIARTLEKVDSDSKTLREVEKQDPRAASIYKSVQELKEEFRGSSVMKPIAVYGFFPAGSYGNRLFVNASPQGKSEILHFDFPRQPKKDGLCLSDYVLPTSAQPAAQDLEDNVAAFVTSVGQGVREIAEKLKAQGEYLKSHIIQVLALESAEAYAEFLHAHIRSLWGYPDPMEMTMMERFQAKYHGKRYSFGYPACPRLEDQAVLFKMLNAEQIGVQLTDGFMMDPEASVSALVFHHPQASYFSAGVHAEDFLEANPRFSP